MEEDFLGDVELQILTQKYQMVHPFIQCPSRRQSVQLCTNRRCKLPSFKCGDQHCIECLKHSTCSSIKLTIITKMVRNIADSEREFLMRILQIEDIALKHIHRNRRQQLEKHKFSSLEGQSGDIIEALYFKGRPVMLTGQKADQFVYALKDKQGALEEGSKPLLQEFRKEMEGLVGSIDMSLRQKIDHFCRSHHEIDYLIQKQLPIQLKLKPPTNALQVQKYRQMNILQQSNIIDKADTARIRFIHENLLEPTELELIYRASEHGFTAKSFHNNIQFTLTLFKTQFGNIIAGFTPNTWNSSIGWSEDPTYSTFLLSLDLIERIELKEPTRSTFCHEDWGPCFGDDLTVGDRCGAKPSCETAFPSSFRSNLKQLSYGSSEARRRLFGGPRKFRLTEYEVYRVIW